MADITATVQEIVGDPDNDNAKLAVPSTVVGGAADGDPVGAKLIVITPSLSFLVLGPNIEGDEVLTVEEIQGDADADTKWLDGPKTVITQPDGTQLSGTLYDTAEGPVSVFPITA